MKFNRVVAALSLGLVASGAVAANPAQPVVTADAYLKPHVHPGQQIADVYSKSMSWSGPGLKGYVKRYSGVSTYTITAVTPDAIVFDEADRTDGQPPAAAVHGAKILADGNTNCYEGKCRVNDQTSGVFFIPLLWGRTPQHVHAGSSWTAKIDKPWEIGPTGTEQVRVVSVDPANGEITLTRHGSGSGSSSDMLQIKKAMQKAGKSMTVTTTDGKKIDVTLVPGEATWSGYTTVRRGVVIGDEIMLTQQVKFVARNGKTWNAELRVYTLLNLGNGDA